MSLTLVMHGRENTEGDSEAHRIIGDVDAALCDRLKNCAKAAAELNASVEITLGDGETISCDADTLKATIECDGSIDFNFTRRVRKAWPISASITGRLSVEMISRALERSAGMSKGRATGYLTFESGRLYLFDTDQHSEQEELVDLIDELLNEEPAVVDAELAHMAHAVIEQSDADTE